MNLSPLTAAADAENHWIGGPATVASLDAANLPSFGPILGGSSGFDHDPHSPVTLGLPATVASLCAASFGPILAGSSGFDRDPHSPATLGLFVDYMASAFADRNIGLMVTPMEDPAIATTPQLLTTSHS